MSETPANYVLNSDTFASSQPPPQVKTGVLAAA